MFNSNDNYAEVSKTGGAPAHVWQVYGQSVPGPNLDNLRSWKAACSVIYTYVFVSCRMNCIIHLCIYSCENIQQHSACNCLVPVALYAYIVTCIL